MCFGGYSLHSAPNGAESIRRRGYKHVALEPLGSVCSQVLATYTRRVNRAFIANAGIDYATQYNRPEFREIQ